jgi:hypothetical protein
MRLKNLGIQKNISVEKIFKKLRCDYAPKALLNMFYSFNITLDELIERVVEFERFSKTTNKFHKKHEVTYNKSKENRHKNIQNIKCFKCGKMGHYRNDCKTKNKL